MLVAEVYSVLIHGVEVYKVVFFIMLTNVISCTAVLTVDESKI
jgi:hypothetical protein